MVRSMDETLALAQKFIKIKSVAGSNDSLSEILTLAESQFDGFTVEKFISNGKQSLLAYVAKERPKRFRLILNGHLDVTPGEERQYQPVIREDKMYGVGAMDMKSSAACLITVFKETARDLPYPLGLQLTTEEQQGGFDGTGFQVAQGVRADFVIAGESTALNIAHRAKGVLWIKATVKGGANHSAYPWMGDNPAYKVAEFIESIRQVFPIPQTETQDTTVALSNFLTNNQTFNKTPSHAEVWLDVRYAPEDSNGIVKKIKALLPAGDWQFEVLVKEPALRTPPDSTLVTQLQIATRTVLGYAPKLYGAHGTSDARHFAPYDAECVEFGPTGGGIGSSDEWVSLKSLEQYRNILCQFLTSL